MNRRNFCKISALSAGALLAGVLEGKASPLSHSLSETGGLRRRARITVIRRECYQDLQSLYLDDPECGPCRMFATGQSFDVSGSGCPRGFCRKAWASLDGCLDGDGGKVKIAACPDGTRPVIFKVELL